MTDDNTTTDDRTELEETARNALDDVTPESPYIADLRYYATDAVDGVELVTREDKGNKRSFASRHTDALDDAGVEWHYKEDGRFRNGVNKRRIVVTGFTDDTESNDTDDTDTLPYECDECGASYAGDDAADGCCDSDEAHPTDASIFRRVVLPDGGVEEVDPETVNNDRVAHDKYGPGDAIVGSDPTNGAPRVWVSFDCGLTTVFHPSDLTYATGDEDVPDFPLDDDTDDGQDVITDGGIPEDKKPTKCADCGERRSDVEMTTDTWTEEEAVSRGRQHPQTGEYMNVKTREVQRGQDIPKCASCRGEDTDDREAMTDGGTDEVYGYRKGTDKVSGMFCPDCAPDDLEIENQFGNNIELEPLTADDLELFGEAGCALCDTVFYGEPGFNDRVGDELTTKEEIHEAAREVNPDAFKEFDADATPEVDWADLARGDTVAVDFVPLGPRDERATVGRCEVKKVATKINIQSKTPDGRIGRYGPKTSTPDDWEPNVSKVGEEVVVESAHGTRVRINGTGGDIDTVGQKFNELIGGDARFYRDT